MLVFFLVLTAAVIAASASAVFFFTFHTRLSVSDRVSVVGDILAGGTLVLSVIAALVGVAAYAVVTGMPDLQIQIWFGSSDKNSPVFVAVSNCESMRTADPITQTVAAVRVRNQSRYVASSPAIVVSLEGMAFTNPDFGVVDGWSICDEVERVGITAVQWDGGDAYSIHGRSVRRLPDLDLGCLSCTGNRENVRLRIGLFASGGYRREIAIPVRFISAGNAIAVGDKARVVDWI